MKQRCQQTEDDLISSHMPKQLYLCAMFAWVSKGRLFLQSWKGYVELFFVGVVQFRPSSSHWRRLAELRQVSNSFEPYSNLELRRGLYLREWFAVTGSLNSVSLWNGMKWNERGKVGRVDQSGDGRTFGRNSWSLICTNGCHLSKSNIIKKKLEKVSWSRLNDKVSNQLYVKEDDWRWKNQTTPPLAAVTSCPAFSLHPWPYG